jgi:hypothetical protein
MHTFDAITVNNTTIKVDNPTDYYLDQWLYTDYGFNIYYRGKRGIEEVYWNRLLKANGFEEPSFINRGVGDTPNGVYDLDTYSRSLDFHEFLSRSFCIEFTSGKKPYAMFFDHKTWTITMSEEESFWDIL